MKKRSDALVQKTAELEKQYKALNERYRAEHKELLAAVYELEAGLSFAAVHSVYDSQHFLKQADLTLKDLKGLQEQIGKEIAAKLTAMLQQTKASLEESDAEYESLLAKVDKSEANIRVIADLLKADCLRRVYGRRIEEMSLLTGNSEPPAV
jgi:hypothetical protein